MSTLLLSWPGAAANDAARVDGAADDAASPERRAVRAMRRGAIALVAWTALFASWSAWAPIAGGVVAPGLVKVEANRRTVTHRDGGTIAAIRVHEGQRVKQGDVLVELEDARVDAGVDLLRAQLGADLLRQSRLEAEAAGAPRWSPPEALVREFAAVAGVEEQAAKEARTFSARQATLSSQLDGERAQQEAMRAEIAARERERENAARAVVSMRDELKLNEQLEAEHFVNHAHVLALQRAVSDYESRVHAGEADAAQARARLDASAVRVRGLRDGALQSAAEEARELGARIGDTRQRLRASRQDQARQTIVAPEAGVLVNLRVNTVGSALGAHEAIVDIVPSDAPLVVETRLPLDVASEVRPGTPADVRLLSAASRYETLLPARVLQVSADAIADERTGQPYLRAQVAIDPAALAKRGAAWQAGMAAEVYVKTGERTALGFLVEPITGFFRRAFRER
jgi:HlyD family type I secretion membrane fusion protein